MIKKFDNFFDSETQQNIYNYIINSRFTIGWEDGLELQHKLHPNLHSLYTFHDVQNLKILEKISDRVTNNNISFSSFDKCIINLTKPMDVNYVHTHPNQMVFLYYINMIWHEEWGGETIFYKDDGEVLDCNQYTPNRAIFFDGNIKHTIKSQNIIGPTYRFSMSLFFNKI